MIKDVGPILGVWPHWPRCLECGELLACGTLSGVVCINDHCKNFVEEETLESESTVTT